MKIQGRIIAITTLVFLSLFASAQSAQRPPDVAGSFYPSDSIQLYQMVDSMLEQAQPINIDGTPLVLISPHAGFIYSGPTAAQGYKLLERYPNIKTAIILGFKHRVDYRGVAIWADGSWETPLGKVPINEALAKEILMSANYMANQHELFKGEHSLETQLPYLQIIDKGISIVPLQIGLQDPDIVAKVTKTLTDVLKDKKDFIIIASSDMTHYKSRRQCAAIDSVTAKYIEDLDGKGLWSASVKDQAQLCGAAPVAAALEIAKNLGADKAMILKHADSGDYAGNTESVVSYISAVVYKTPTSSGEAQHETKGDNYLSEKEHETLLDIARQSINAYVNGEQIPEFNVPEGKLTEKGAAFVTITENQSLRGCIGYTEPILPLYQTVSTCAIKAASEDPRFRPLTKDEYPKIELEISVLTPLQKINDISKIEVGKHGLMLQKGLYRGLLLPQVATDYGWDRETFLNQTCRKAGMQSECWKDNCDIYIFSAEVFGEK